MPEHHRSKLESFLIHLVAVLFTFTSIAAAFLGYGVTQPNQLVPFRVVTPVQAASYPTWTQTSWGGGQSSDVYTINWNTTGGWTKYASASGVTFGTDEFTIDPGGYIISSVFNPSPKRVVLLLLLNTWPYPSSYSRGASSPSEINSAPWIEPGGGVGGWCSVPLYPYVQYKIENTTGSTITVPDATIYASLLSISGQVKDTTTGNPIQGATVSYSGGSVTTGTQGSYQIETDLVPSTAVNVTASKSGYISQSKSVTSIDGCDDIKSLSFDLTPVSSPSSDSNPPGTPPTQSPGTSSATSQTPSVSLAEIQQIKLPSIFTAPGSTTTDLSKVTDPTKVEGFTLDIPGQNKIVFTEALDLSSEKTVEALQQLDSYVKINSTGTVELDTKALSALNKKATITMYNLEYLFAPEILVGGEKDSKGIVNNTRYDQKTGTLVFGVSHFTTFSAVPRLELINPTSKVIKEADTAISGRISDPEAVVTGELNGVKLATVTPAKETGIFIFTKIKFKDGENELVINAESKLGKVLPLVATITYNQSTTGSKDTATTLSKYGVIVIILVALAFAVLLGYLIYKKKLRIKLGGSNPKNPPQQPQHQTENKL
jgi:hypothetical protein